MLLLLHLSLIPGRIIIIIIIIIIIRRR